MQEVYSYLNFISPISKETWELINVTFQEKNYPRGTHLAKAGRYEHKIGILLDGVLRAYIARNNGSQYTKTLFTPIHFRTPISFFGPLSALVTQSANQVNIEALTEVRVWEASYTEWMEIADQNKEIATWTRRLIELFFVGKEQKEFEFFTLQADSRYKLFRERFPELENLISQYYIAQFIGITPTQLSRIRKKIFREN